jgi:hypothetical protein
MLDPYGIGFLATHFPLTSDDLEFTPPVVFGLPNGSNVVALGRQAAEGIKVTPGRNIPDPTHHCLNLGRPFHTLENTRSRRSG